MQAAKQITLSRNARRCSLVSSLSRSKTESIHLKQKSALSLIDGMLSTAAKASCRSFSSGHVGVEQGQVELHVHGLLEQLTAQVEPPLGELMCW